MNTAIRDEITNIKEPAINIKETNFLSGFTIVY